MLTKETLDAIKARVAAATPGPWYVHYDQRRWVRAYGPSGDHDLADESWKENRDNDALFVAHARQDVPALLDEIERLQARVESLAADKYGSEW